MNGTNFWGNQSFNGRKGVIVRIILATTAVLGSLALALFVWYGHHGEHTARASASIQPAVSVPAGPVSKTWYFAEGRVGNGFREYLTIDNPGSVPCAVNLQYNYTPDGGTPLTKTVTPTVNPTTRLTEFVNGDLGYMSDFTPAASLATIATVNTTTTPTCSGVVVERPMYFANFHGAVSSGTDVLGSTQLSKTFYFADVPSNTTETSYLTILNPNNVTANVSVAYYSNGNKAATQTLAVPANSRGTIAPSIAGLPAGHFATVVNADQLVMVERPTYFTGVSFNNTSISGAYDVVGVPTLANDWLFAEGYTGSSTQEFLTISNLDPANKPAAVTITLRSKTGATNNTTLTVNPNTLTEWNVNANNTFSGSSPEVSAEVKSTGANIIVQREMYFTYSHKLPDGRLTDANGATEVIGQVGPAAHSNYSFAEGYANIGFNEWLTIQNPTSSAEAISITLVNGLGQTNTRTVTVGANTRYTEDIAADVIQFFNPTSTSGFTISMTVQSSNGAVFVVERPMYWHNGGASFSTQGGSDVIGYIGG